MFSERTHQLENFKSILMNKLEIPGHCQTPKCLHFSLLAFFLFLHTLLCILNVGESYTAFIRKKQGLFHKLESTVFRAQRGLHSRLLPAEGSSCALGASCPASGLEAPAHPQAMALKVSSDSEIREAALTVAVLPRFFHLLSFLFICIPWKCKIL